MTQYGFYFDSTRCTGCKTCEMVCKDYNDLGLDILFRRVYDYEGGDWKLEDDGAWAQTVFAYHLTVSCNHCDSPACVANCPTGSMAKSEETGLVYNDPSTCIGCGTCVKSCPYEAPRIDEQEGISRKCNGCNNRVAEGLDPVCVTACPMRALEFGPIETLRSKYGTLADLLPLPDSGATSPNLVLKSNSAAEVSNVGSGFIANPLEVQ